MRQFQCAQPWPTVPGGKRRLPHHPREYEWHAQRRLRNADQLVKGDDQLWVFDDDGVWKGAMHLHVRREAGAVEVVLEAVGVSFSCRGDGGPSYGDAIMRQVRLVARSLPSPDVTTLVLSGWIHEGNRASQRMALRNGMEPTTVRLDAYQQWVAVLVGPVGDPTT